MDRRRSVMHVVYAGRRKRRSRSPGLGQLRCLWALVLGAVESFLVGVTRRNDQEILLDLMIRVGNGVVFGWDIVGNKIPGVPVWDFDASATNINLPTELPRIIKRNGTPTLFPKYH